MGVATALSGALLAGLAATCYGASNVCYSRVQGRSMSSVVVATLVWNVVCLSVALLIRDGGLGSALAVPAVALVLFVVVGVLASLVGRIGLLLAISRIGPSRASTIKNCAPVFSLVLGVVLFSQVPTVGGVLGILTILTGIACLGFDRERLPANSLVTVAEVPEADPSLERSAGAPQRVAPARSRDLLLGVVFGLLVAVTFAVSDSFRFLAFAWHADSLLATWMGGLAALGVAVVWHLGAATRYRDVEKIRTLLANGWILGAGVASSVGLLANFEAVTRIYVGYVTAMVALAPVTTALIGKVASPGRERLGRASIASMALVILGTAVIVAAG